MGGVLYGMAAVRRVLVQKYQVRYVIAGTDVTVLRIFHAPVDR
jgi:hypothetical protein